MGADKVWLVALLVACVQGAMILTSPEFKNFDLIPPDFGCDVVTGQDRDPFKPSPPLEWQRVPVKAKSFVLLMDDMDADGFVHWLVTDIPRDVTSLDIDASGVAMPDGCTEHVNSYGGYGWGGPCPHGEKHRYRFRIFAMDTPTVSLTLSSNATQLRADVVEAQLAPRALYVAVLTGDYECPIYTTTSTTPIPVMVPVHKQPLAPIEMRRYLKPSESLKKAGKLQGVFDNETYVQCKSGELSAQLCKRFEVKESQPDKLVAEYFPPNTVSATTVDPTAGMSESEQEARSVRSGGLEPLNSSREGQTGSIVPIQPLPSVSSDAFATEDDMNDPVNHDNDHEMNDCGTKGENNLIELESSGDLEVMHNDTMDAVTDLTASLSAAAGPAPCPCEGVIAPQDRRYYLTLRSPGLLGVNLLSSYACDPSAPSVSRPSMPFLWRNPPPAAKSYVLMVDDVTEAPSSPDFGKVLWLVTNIPVQESSIVEGASGTTMMPAGSEEQINSFGSSGYTAPCPLLHEQRRYRGRLYALTSETCPPLSLPPAYTATTVQDQLSPILTSAMEFHFLSMPPPTTADGDEVAQALVAVREGERDMKKSVGVMSGNMFHLDMNEMNF